MVLLGCHRRCYESARSSSRLQLGCESAPPPSSTSARSASNSHALSLLLQADYSVSAFGMSRKEGGHYYHLLRAPFLLLSTKQQLASASQALA